MNPAIPTPFDIIPPPPPLWTPSLQIWALLLTLIVVTILLILMRNRKIPPPALGYREQLLGDIRRTIAHHDNVNLEYVVQLALRALSYTTGEDYGSESASTLRRRAENTTNPLVSELMEAIAASKDQLYAPRLSQDDVKISARKLAVRAEEILSAALLQEPSK